MFKNLSVKNKTLLFVVLSLIVFTVVLLVTIYFNQKSKLQNLEKRYHQNMQTSYEKILEQHRKFHYHRLQNIVNMQGVKQLLLQKDREKLYELVKPHFEMLKEENSYLKLMHFHLPEGISFLRVHKRDKYGDNIAKKRPMAAQMHQTQKPLAGFEAGIYMLAYREFIPIFHQQRYIGAVELGSRPDQILAQMDYFANIKGALFIKENKIIQYAEQSKIKRGDYRLQYSTLQDERLIDHLPKEYNFKDVTQISFGGRTYAVYPFEMLDYAKKESAKAVFFNDITQMKSAFAQTVKQLIVLLVGLMGLLVIVINLGFSKIIATVEKVNEKMKTTVARLQEKERQVAQYVRLIDENIITSSTDLEGKITYVSKAFSQISGYDKEELIGQNHRIIRHDDMPESIYKTLWQRLNKGQAWSGEIKNRRKDGGYYWVKASIYPIFDKDGEKTGYTAIRQDITDKKIIEHISITDGLTDIYNRRHFNDTFPKVINSAKRKDELICFLLMDIDHFKQYNDNYGHQMGDDVLIQFAQCLKESLKRADDLAFRLGGEEFGIIYKADDKEKAFEFANHVKKRIQSLKITHDYTSLEEKVITASMGLVCAYARTIENMDEVFKKADELLYKSKENGRNKVSVND